MPGTPRVQYAGFWLRFLAYLIDSLVLSVPAVFLVFLMFVGMAGSLSQIERRNEVVPVLGSILFLILFYVLLFAGLWLYYAIMESSSWQATLGKKALNLQVTDLDGRRISFGRASGRFFGKLISGMILNIGYIMAGFTEKKQALHDMIAGCLVLRR
ncbi:MAG TPA: RDD family protein [Candidatus Acidoferrales bacterium]|nr:RDD family protein [Candidatus Acidoferrales bacterium]